MQSLPVDIVTKAFEERHHTQTHRFLSIWSFDRERAAYVYHT
jgi:hypothetical protein